MTRPTQVTAIHAHETFMDVMSGGKATPPADHVLGATGFTSVIMNAKKPEPPQRIVLAVIVDKQTYHDGIMVTPELIQGIFERFHKLMCGLVGEVPVGVALVQGMLERHPELVGDDAPHSERH